MRRAWRALTGTWVGRVVGIVVLLALVAGAVVVTGGGDGDDDVAVTTTRPPAPSSTASTTTQPSVPEEDGSFLPENQEDNGTRAPLTGLPVADPATLDRPVLAVKIDNLDQPRETARPQFGLAFADVVVEVVVEGGITRFIALFHSTDPPETGPVRSARTTDVRLLPAFGPTVFAYSGGNGGTIGALRGSPHIEDQGGEWAPAFFRHDERRAPHDLFLRPWEVWARARTTAPPRPLGVFRERGQGYADGEPVQGVDLDLPGSDAPSVDWRWLADSGRWLRAQQGTLHVDGAGWTVGPRNVVILFTSYGTSPADPRSPEAVTVGSGEAWVLTDGQLVRGRWDRPTEADGINLSDAQGRPVTLTPGRTWIEVVRPGVATVVP